MRVPFSKPRKHDYVRPLIVRRSALAPPLIVITAPKSNLPVPLLDLLPQLVPPLVTLPDPPLRLLDLAPESVALARRGVRGVNALERVEQVGAGGGEVAEGVDEGVAVGLELGEVVLGALVVVGFGAVGVCVCGLGVYGLGA